MAKKTLSKKKVKRITTRERQLINFSAQASMLAGIACFVDYEISRKHRCIEPEMFFDKWSKKFIDPRICEELKEIVWKVFLLRLKYETDQKRNCK